MTSVLNVDTIAAKDGTSPVELTKQHAAKSWNCLNGTGTIAIRDSFNVSSIEDVTTGTYRTIVTNNLINSDYASMWEAVETNNGNTARNYSATESATTRTTSANTCRTGWTGNNASGTTDPATVSNTINGDLA
jgi:hypothetical protein